MRAFLRYVLLVTVLCAGARYDLQARAEDAARRALPEVRVPLVVTQAATDGSDRSRLVLVRIDGSTKALSDDLFAARDPEVSFDGARILFSGKETAEDRWAIYEMLADGSGRRRVIASDGDCRHPRYLSTLYTIVSDKPWYQIVFVGEGINGSVAGANLYSCKLDGSELERLTYNLGRNSAPFLMPDGRVLFGVDHPGKDGGSIFGLNIDGTDYATFLGEQGKALNRMPSATNRGLVVFVESDQFMEDGGGTLAAVSVRRPLHSYRSITEPGEGIFHSPAPGPAGAVLVSRRSTGGGDTYGVVLLDPSSRKLRVVFDDRDYHDLQAQQIVARPEPDGRSSVVTAKDPHGELYCLNVAQSDDESITRAVKNKKAKTIRVYEGKATGLDETGLPIVEGHVLGEVPLAADGSFNLKVPANTPLQIHLVDDGGKTLGNCGWIWSRNHEPRGCIGCHEDGELTPENWFVDALKEHSTLIGKDAPDIGSIESANTTENKHSYGESE